jgi:hypothetical protein
MYNFNKVPAKKKEIHLNAHDCNVGYLYDIKPYFGDNIGKIGRYRYS